MPKATSRITDTTAAIRAVTSAQPNESIWSAPGAIAEAACSISASAISTRMNPAPTVYGSRIAAITGGTSAFRMATSAATTSAPKKPLTRSPGTMYAAAIRPSAEPTQATATG